MKYDASCIKILRGSEISFFWTEVTRISKVYSKPHEFIDRVLEACLLYGKSIEWFESVYCLQDGKYEKDIEFSLYYAEFLKDRESE